MTLSNESLRQLAKSGSDKAKEILRNREQAEKYLKKMYKLEKDFPNMRKNNATITDIFHYGKLTAYSEIILYLQDIEKNTLIEKLEITN